MREKTILSVRRASLLCALFLLLSSLPFSAFSENLSYPQKSEATAVLLLHLESGRVLDSKNPGLTVPAGSSVKLLSGLLLCELSATVLDESVVVEKSMLTGVTGHKLGLSAGDALTVNDLLCAALCGSYNDAFYVLATYLCGSKSDFVNAMNERATKAGMKNSRFTDPTGIDDASTTTANDLALVAKVAYENDLYMQFTSLFKKQTSVKTVTNRNELIYSTTTNAYHNALCHGMTAGNTTQAGSCVITVATSDGQNYLSIVLGGQKSGDVGGDFGYLVTNRMVKFAVNNFAVREIVEINLQVCSVPVTMSDTVDSVKVVTADSLTAFLPKSAEIGTDVTYSVRLNRDSLEAPFAEGDFVGYLAVVYGGEVIGSVPLRTAAGAEKSRIVGILGDLQKLTQNRAGRAGGIFFAVCFLGWMAAEILYRRIRRKRWDAYFERNP